MTRMLVMANSKKLGGRCVAGFDLNGLRWVRPTSSAVGSPLWPSSTMVVDGGRQRPVRPLDIVDFTPGRVTASPSHPEDVELRGNFSLVKQITLDDARVLLAEHQPAADTPFGSQSEFLDSMILESKPIGRSLESWAVEKVQMIRKTDRNGRLGVWGRIDFEGEVVTYKITDDDFLLRHPHLMRLDNPLLTFSIGEPFSPNGLPLRNYILIAGVLIR